jgi:hypothetical protein
MNSDGVLHFWAALTYVTAATVKPVLQLPVHPNHAVHDAGLRLNALHTL